MLAPADDKVFGSDDTRLVDKSLDHEPIQLGRRLFGEHVPLGRGDCDSNDVYQPARLSSRVLRLPHRVRVLVVIVP